jgi:RNA polymerase sigma factor, sigma-70 family
MTVYEQIFNDFKKGDISSFYEKMYPEILIFTSRILGKEFGFLSEDCVQDAVFKTYQMRQSFSSPFQIKVYLYTCVRNKAISILRKGNAKQNYVSQLDDYENDYSLTYIEQETLTLLYEAIDSLPDKYRTLFDLSFEQGLKNAEVAKLLNLAEVTVKKQKARLIGMLRDNLKGKMGKEYIVIIMYLLESY